MGRSAALMVRRRDGRRSLARPHARSGVVGVRNPRTSRAEGPERVDGLLILSERIHTVFTRELAICIQMPNPKPALDPYGERNFGTNCNVFEVGCSCQPSGWRHGGNFGTKCNVFRVGCFRRPRGRRRGCYFARHVQDGLLRPIFSAVAYNQRRLRRTGPKLSEHGWP